MDEATPRIIDVPASGIRRRTALAGLVGGGVSAGLVIFGVSRSRGSQQTVLRPEDFARPADGDDAAPMIQAAIERVAAAGGGTVRLTAGKTYPLRAIAGGSDVSQSQFRSSLAIPAGAANVTIDLNGAILVQQSDAYTFGAAYRLFNDPQMRRTRRPLSYTPRRGDTSIRVADPQAYPPGSRIMLVSGDVFPPARKAEGNDSYTPIAEMFAVTGASEGAILLDRPVEKDHGLARGKDVGLIDITRNFAQNLRLIGPGTIINRYRRAGAFRQVFGFTMERVRFEGAGGFSIRGRDISVTDCDVQIIRTDGIQPYAIAFDTGSENITVKRFRATGDPFCFIHLHEGLSKVLLSDVQIHNAWAPDPGWIDDAAISIAGLSWNVDLENVVVVNNPQGPGISARESKVMDGGNYGLTLHDVTLKGSFRGPALQINDKNAVQISGLDVSGVQLARGQQALKLQGARHRIVDLHT